MYVDRFIYLYTIYVYTYTIMCMCIHICIPTCMTPCLENLLNAVSLCSSLFDVSRQAQAWRARSQLSLLEALAPLVTEPRGVGVGEILGKLLYGTVWC